MGKRSTFARRPQDAYDTPREAVLPLLPHLPERCRYVEPCAGAGQLMAVLESAGHRTVDAFDIRPRGDRIRLKCALKAENSLCDGDLIITNPPWTRTILHPMIEHFRALRPTWLLFDADWMHTRQAAPFLPYCHTIISIGRVKWIPDSPFTGKDNAAWFGFGRDEADTRFIGREAA